MRVLVTGAGGQLGTSLPRALQQHECVLRTRAALDIADLAAVRATVNEVRPDVVINAAAYNAVDGAESDPDGAFRGNAVGPRNLAVATAAAGAALVHVSTDYVFDGRATRPYHEYDRPSPQSAYGRSKLAGEEAVRVLQPRSYIVRTAWVYHTQGNNFPKTMRRLASNGEVRVVSDQFGSPTYAPHLADGIARLIESEAFGTYHMAGAGEASWFELTRCLFRELGVEAEVRPVSTAEFPRPAERPRYSVLTTIQEPRIVLPPWQEGLAEYARRVRNGEG